MPRPVIDQDLPYLTASQTVAFDSGYEDWTPAWSTLQPRIAKWTRACSYDRAGAGFSDPGPMPRTSVRIAKELHTALHRAGIAAPYILVGHAFGGDNVRTFAVLCMHEVAGMVMDDTDFTDLEPKEMQDDDRENQQTRVCSIISRDGRALLEGRNPRRSQKLKRLPESGASRSVS